MSKKVCICGKDATKTKPLVITITTCKNKHPGLKDNSKSCPPDHPTAPGSSDKSRSRTNSAKLSSRHSLSETMNSTGNTTYFGSADSFADTSTPITKNQTNASRSAFKKASAIGMDKRRLSFNNIDVTDIISDNEDNQQNTLQTSEADEDEDSEIAALQLLGKYINEASRDVEKTRRNTNTSSQITFPHISFNDTGQRKTSKPKNPSNSFTQSMRPIPVPPSPYRSIVVQAVGQTEDKVFNFPSDVALKLPILPSRYHGPGCAMEINVMEKHSKNCKYKKLKNPMRNPADDRVGSYEVIGRIMYKTCQVGNFNMSDLTEKKSSSIPYFGKIFSLMSVPTNKKKTYVLNASTSERRVESLNDILNGLVRSSKSSPANLKNKSSIIGYGDKNDSEVNNYWLNSKKCDVEEIFFSGKKYDRSLRECKQEHKKWYMFLLPCIFMQKSHTHISTP